ncbi:MAG TPA: DUF350 domain-containing protein [Planctomycetota bacterium]|nr:DUF350 domain-containing protein [Planctomycetota bacterium]
MDFTWERLPQLMAMSAIFTVCGVLLFGASFWAMSKVCPFSIRKEIEEDHNVALAIVMASVILGLSWIVSTAIS